MRYVIKLLKLSLEHQYEWNSNTAEAPIGDVLQEKMLLEILQNSQENTSGVSFLIMLKARPEVEAQSEKSHHEKEPPPPFPFN